MAQQIPPPRLTICRGLFRAWVVVSLLWATALALLMPDTRHDTILGTAIDAALLPAILLAAGYTLAWVARGFWR